MKKNTIRKRKLRKDCFDMNRSFIVWLLEHCEVYLKDADKIVDLSYHSFTFEGKKYTQKELISTLISKCSRMIEIDDTWNNEYNELDRQVHEIWMKIHNAMWW